jgi:hypothetical protein
MTEWSLEVDPLLPDRLTIIRFTFTQIIQIKTNSNNIISKAGKQLINFLILRNILPIHRELLSKTMLLYKTTQILE